MKGGHAPDLGTGQLAHAQLQADRKQQQGDTEVGRLAQKGTAFRAQSVEHETGDQKTDQGRQPDVGGQQAERKGDKDPHRIAVIDRRKQGFHRLLCRRHEETSRQAS